MRTFWGKLLVFVSSSPDAQGMKGIRAVLLDPGRWQDALEPWAEADVQVDAGQGQTPMRSRQTPGFSVDPGDGSLVGVLVAEDGAMDAVIGSPEGSATIIPLPLPSRNQTWLGTPRVGVHDVNDCDTFLQLMAPSLTMLGREPFFAGMPEGHRAALEDANRVRLPREVRRVESFFLCPTCPPMPFEVGCEGGAP